MTAPHQLTTTPQQQSITQNSIRTAHDGTQTAHETTTATLQHSKEHSNSSRHHYHSIRQHHLCNHNRTTLAQHSHKTATEPSQHTAAPTQPQHSRPQHWHRTAIAVALTTTARITTNHQSIGYKCYQNTRHTTTLNAPTRHTTLNQHSNSTRKYHNTTTTQRSK